MLWALEQWWDDWGKPLVVGVVIVAVGLSALISAINFGIMRPSCHAATRDMRLAARWSFWGGCQVYSAREGWIPIEALTVVTTVER